MNEFYSVISQVYVDEFYRAIYIAGFIAAIAMIEFLRPVKKHLSLRGRLRNIGFGAVYIGLGSLLLGGIVYVANMFINIDVGSEETLMAAIVTTVIYAVFIDHSFYWYHRFEHASPRFWMLHELHHAEDEMNVFTGMRTYFLEKPMQYLVISLPLIFLSQYIPILQLGSLSGPLLGFVLLFGLYFSHANARIGFGPLSWVFVSPQLHRIHHSLEQKHFDKNFAQFFPFIDILYGTYYHPGKGEYPETGTKHLASTATLSHVMARPFRKWFLS